MGKSAMLSDEAYARLQAAKESKSESLSDVIVRFVPPPIRTFGDLEKALEQIDGPIIPDLEAVERLRRKNAH
jgi:predicted CopG family antitoxin